MKKNKIIITYGTFDLFHVGHVRLLKRIKKLGDTLIVVLSSDEFNSLKGKKTVIPFEDRKEVLESCRYVDVVLEEKNWDQKIHDIKNNNVDIFVMGDDWEGEFDFLSSLCEVIYLPRTNGVSTTHLKEVISKIF